VATFQRKYDPKNIAALVSVVLDHGYRAEDACEAAAAGNLPGRYADLPAFDMNAATLKSYVLKERRRRRVAEVAGAAPREALQRASGELVALLDREVERLRGKQAKQGAIRAADIREVAAAAREVGKLIRELPPGTMPGAEGRDPTGKPRATKPTPGEGGFLEALAQEHETDGATAL
jgi:hypothetical protein